MASSADNNIKLFHRYAKMLGRNDVEVYTSHADKLARWLCDEKAYYPVARKEIMRLLLISQRTLRKAVTGSDDFSLPFNVSDYLSHPLAAPYIRLVRAMEPFRHLFVEPSYQVHLTQLLNSIVVLGPPSSSVSQGVAAGAISQELSSSHLVQQPASAPADISSKVTEPTAGTSFPTKIKVKKKKTIDFESLVAQDIKALRQRQENSQPQPISNLPRPSTASQIGQRGIDSDLSPATVSVHSKSSNLYEPRSIRGHADERVITSNKDLPNGITQDPLLISVGPDSNTKSLTAPATHFSKKYTNKGQDQSPLIQVGGSDVGDSMHVDGSSEMTAISFVNSNNDKEVRDEHPQAFATETSPVLYSLPPTSEHEVGQQQTEPPYHVLPISLSDKDEEMQDINHEQSSHLESGQLGVTPTVELSDTRRAYSNPSTTQLPGLLDTFNTNSPVGRSITSLNLLGNAIAEVVLPTTRPKCVPLTDSSWSASEVQGNQAGVFGDEMRVVARQKGLSSKSRISVEFDIPEGQYAILMQWVNRKHTSFDLRNSLCLSLGCYSAVELHEDRGGAATSFEQQISSLCSSWPAYGSLSMHVSVNDNRADLPLSPPFLTTPDGLVDVSQFLSVGKNILELHQRQDLSDFIFVLHAHHPTRRQLEQVSQRRRKDHEWRDWLQRVSLAIDVPVGPV